MKRTVEMIIVFSLFFLLGITAYAQGEAVLPETIELIINAKTAFVDNRSVTLEIPPVIVQGNTLVPLRFVGEAFNSTFAWEAKTRQVTITQGTSKVLLWIGKKEGQIDGRKTTLAVAPQIEKGRTMVPLRFIGEAFGCEVNYNHYSKLITIKKSNNPPCAAFELDREMAFVGEQITYKDLSTDPDGDAIIDWEWDNKNDTFSTPGTYTISLRVRDSRGAWSAWSSKTIEISELKPVAKFRVNKTTAYPQEIIEYFDESYVPDNIEIVDWEWENKHDFFETPGTYQVGLRVKDKEGRWSNWFRKNITILEPPNTPPVARFIVHKTKVDQGETVIYTDQSYDPDGDAIVEYKWTGKKRAYFKEGIFPVTYSVKDAKGDWSEPYTIEIEVTNKVLMTELDYNLRNPLPGEIVNLSGINPLDFPLVEPEQLSDDGTTLLLSNCPETVWNSGILYKDMAKGPVRLMYYHKNSSETPKRMYILAKNMESQSISIRTLKKGLSGPSTDELGVGRTGLIRYLESNTYQEISLAPGETVIFDDFQNGRAIARNFAALGIFDLITDGNVMFYFVMADQGTDILKSYDSLPVLEKDAHHRGTFYGANRNYYIDIKGSQPRRFTFTDNVSDPQIWGIDALTGEHVVNKGNYGVVYNLRICTDTNIGVLTNPRGGVFAGASLLPDRTVYQIPENGIVQDSSQAVMNMVIEKYREGEFLFVPPASSNMPVSLLFIPF
ncbi:MAG: stalk domain-containing protein [Bacillota bacterium]